MLEPRDQDTPTNDHLLLIAIPDWSLSMALTRWDYCGKTRYCPLACLVESGLDPFTTIPYKYILD